MRCHRIRVREFPLLALLLIALALIFSPAGSAQTKRHTSSPAADSKPPSRDNYVGDAACRGCHEKETKAYEANAHHLTSQEADAHSIAGNFTPGANVFRSEE